MGVPPSLARAAAMYKTSAFAPTQKTANDLAGEESALILPMAPRLLGSSRRLP